MKIKRKKNRFNKVIVLFLLISVAVFMFFRYINKKSKDTFMEYSIIETKKIISKVIVDSINNEVLNNIDMNNIFIVFKNSAGKVESIDVNSKYINFILNSTSNLLDSNLNKLEKEKSIFELPLFNNGILSNIFPKIPVRINLIGNVLCVIDTKIETYGINNALFKISLNIKSDIRILLPFVSHITSIDTSVPIVIKLIEGNIPSYLFSDYFNKTYSN